ncbi:hypothetical protein K1719_019810 [Acacia pycnantha]|nr:hypothetical protein K1719_019810 [Acacia pycnantha]
MNPRYRDEVRFVRREDRLDVQYICKVHRDDQFIPFYRNLCIPFGNRYFRIRVNCMRRDGLAPNPDDLRSSMSRNFLNVPQDLIAQNVRQVLFRFNIPREFCNPMIAEILNAAHHMANTACRSMVVDIMVETFDYNRRGHRQRRQVENRQLRQVEIRQLRQVAEQSMEDQHQALVPPSKASIEELERVKIGGGGEKEGPSGCSICWEDFKADDEAIRMPCEHLFHSSCILNWLQRRISCPLCRFELPPAVDDD